MVIKCCVSTSISKAYGNAGVCPDHIISPGDLHSPTHTGIKFADLVVVHFVFLFGNITYSTYLVSILSLLTYCVNRFFEIFFGPSFWARGADTWLMIFSLLLL